MINSTNLLQVNNPHLAELSEEIDQIVLGTHVGQVADEQLLGV